MYSTTQEFAANNPGTKVIGDPDKWVIICGVKNRKMHKTTKAMEVPGGVLVQVTSAHFEPESGKIAPVSAGEALHYLPGVTIHKHMVAVDPDDPEKGEVLSHGELVMNESDNYFFREYEAQAVATNPGAPNLGNDPVALAGVMYTAYIEAVGGIAHNGDVLPSWDEFLADPNKTKQSNGWITAAKATIQNLDILDPEDVPDYRQERKEAQEAREYQMNFQAELLCALRALTSAVNGNKVAPAPKPKAKAKAKTQGNQDQ